MKKIFFTVMSVLIMISFSYQSQGSVIKDKSENVLYTYIDSSQFMASIYWEDAWSDLEGGDFELVVVADNHLDEPLYSDKVQGKSIVFSYPEQTKKLNIQLYYQTGEEERLLQEKDIELMDGEFLRGNQVSEKKSPQLNLAYYSLEESTLYIEVNDNRQQQVIYGEGTIAIDLESGNNRYEVFFEGQEHIIYGVSGEVFYNTVPPSIQIYDETYVINQETERASIQGKVENGSYLMINQREVILDNNGEFEYDVELNEGKNRITLFAKSEAGVSSFRSIIIDYQREKATQKSNVWKIVFGSVAGGCAVLVLALYLVKKRKKN